MSKCDPGWTRDLFDDGVVPAVEPLVPLAEGATVLRGFAAHMADELWIDIGKLVVAAPLRLLVTPGGLRMSVAMSNCGALGWVSDRRGYRYDAVDPDSGRAWPPMPVSFAGLAAAAAEAAGYAGFEPDACLINRYEPGARHRV